jgi:hypothetical protein
MVLTERSISMYGGAMRAVGLGTTRPSSMVLSSPGTQPRHCSMLFMKHVFPRLLRPATPQPRCSSGPVSRRSVAATEALRRCDLADETGVRKPPPWRGAKDGGVCSVAMRGGEGSVLERLRCRGRREDGGAELSRWLWPPSAEVTCLLGLREVSGKCALRGLAVEREESWLVRAWWSLKDLGSPPLWEAQEERHAGPDVVNSTVSCWGFCHEVLQSTAEEPWCWLWKCRLTVSSSMDGDVSEVLLCWLCSAAYESVEL